MGFWISVAVVLGVVLLAAAIFDWRARAKGHRLRGAASLQAVTEANRDIKAGQAQGFRDDTSSVIIAPSSHPDPDPGLRVDEQITPDLPRPSGSLRRQVKPTRPR